VKHKVIVALILETTVLVILVQPIDDLGQLRRRMKDLTIFVLFLLWVGSYAKMVLPSKVEK
jgi:hypothetical protein